jgi:hypothetical protein
MPAVAAACPWRASPWGRRPASLAGTVNVRLFDRQASGAQPTVIGQSFDLTSLPPLTGTGANVPD